MTERDLSARGVTHRFGDRVALDSVDLTVPAGSVVGLLGPNGAGKSTLMRIMFGVIDADEGEIRIGDRPATESDRRSWGYMPQERGLYRDMVVIDHLVWLARLHGLSRNEGTQKADDLLERLGVADRRGDKIKELSGGMAQRVQLAAAMVHDPPVLVLDEPFAGLDPTAVGFLSDVVVAHADGGGHVLFSSHQLDLVEDLCQTITMIDDGRIVLHGEVRELKAASKDRYLRVDVAVDDVAANRFGAEVVDRNAAGTRLRLAPGSDALEVLHGVRADQPVLDFAVEGPSLSELFLQAVGHSPEEAETSRTPPAPSESQPASTGESR